MWIRMYCPETTIQHIFPVPDADGHRIAEDGKCPCGAIPDAECSAIIIHRSADGREAIEDAVALLSLS